MTAPACRTAWRLAAALVSAILVALAPQAARAHASLIAAEPADGSVLPRAPEYLTLDFNEPVAPLVLRLLGPDGGQVALGEIIQQNARVLVRAPEILAKGTHALSWRVVSADGHPIGGTVLFSIGAPSAGVTAAASPAERTLKAAIWTARLALYVALFVGVGGAFFCCWIGRGLPVGAERAIICALWLAGVAAPVTLGLQGADLLALPVGAVASLAPWHAAAQTSFMATIALDYLAVLLASGALAMKSVLPARLLSAAAVAALGFAFAASGHASTAPPQLVTRAAVFLHATGLAFWIGALLPLGALLWQRGASARDSLQRFSRAAPWAVLPLIASGIVLAAVQVQRADALWSTDYGKLLLCKLALLAILALLVGWNRFRLTPRVAAGDQQASRLMARSIASELVLVLAILAVVAGWRFTPPPRSLAAAASTPVYVHIHTDRAMADVEIVPGRAGPVQATIRLMTGDFAPLRAKEVTMILSNPSAGIEPIERTAQFFDESAWRVNDLIVPAPGRWTVRVDILISDFEKIMLEDKVSIRR